MKVKYGAYQHPSNEVNLASFIVRHNYSPRRRRISVTYTAHLQGELITDPEDSTVALAQAKLHSRIQQLITVYSQNYQDFALLHDDGSLTRHYLISADALDGVRVIHRSWPKGDSTEYASARTFYIVLEAEYLADESQLYDWQETVQVLGNGGADIRVQDTMLGPPIAEQVCSQTHVRVTQYGQAVGLSTWPAPPGPLFPAYEHANRRTISLGTPRSFLNGNLYYPLSWTYHHSTPTYTAAYPNVR